MRRRIQEETVSRGGWLVSIIVGLAIVTVGPRQAGLAQQPVETHVVPLRKFSPEHRFEMVWGDPAKSGEPFVIRIHAEAGYIIMPHTHPVDEHIVVVKGSWALGMGDRFNRQALEPMEVGTFGLSPKTMAHFAFSKTYTIIQVHGIGPFTVRNVVPIYDLTEKGVLLKEYSMVPGLPTPTSPPGCFVLKLGDRVRASYGEGVVVEAQCTPGQLTQYRVEKPDGDHFWAQRDELNTPDSRVDEESGLAANQVNSRIRRVTSPQVAEPTPGTWSNCLLVNGVAYISGMTARGNDGKVVAGDEYEQSTLTFAKIRNLVEAAGGKMADVVKLTIFVTDITQREKVWRARREVFAGDFPASTLVQVAALAEPSVKVEIDAIAHIGAGKR